MTVDDNTIEIHLIKLVDKSHLINSSSQLNSCWQLDWLVDRRHCSKDWNERSVAIRAKIQQAILDISEQQLIKKLPASSLFLSLSLRFQ